MDNTEFLDTIEETLDTMDDALDIMESSVNVVKNNPWVIAGVAVLALSVGATAGYFVAKKKLEPKYEKILKDEIATAKKFYSALHKRDNYETPESTVESLGLASVEVDEAADAILQYQGEEANHSGLIDDSKVSRFARTVEDIEVQSISLDETPAPHHGKVEVIRNIFADAQSDDDFDYVEELKHRTTARPYVISHDEYMENAIEYNQVQFTYYEGDDVLADETDKAIEDVDYTVGESNLQRFGHGSKDNKIVYVRNDQLDLDFEIIHSSGKFVEEVLGFMEHSEERKRGRVRRFRGDDE